MLSQKQIEAASEWEIRGTIENIDHKIRQLQHETLQLKDQKNDLKIALCLKVNGEHKYELAGKDHHGTYIYQCRCGAIKR